MITSAYARPGFSLVEVIVAVGIFAGAIVVVLALFGPLNRSIGEVADLNRAARLADLIDQELRRVRDSQSGPASGKLAAVASRLMDGGVLTFYASADGGQVIWEADANNDPLGGNPPGIAPRNRYYQIEIRNQPAPFSYNENASFLALTATVRWPHIVATGPDADDYAVSDPAQAQRLSFNFALSQ